MFQGFQTQGLEGWPPAGFPVILPYLLLITGVRRLANKELQRQVGWKHV